MTKQEFVDRVADKAGLSRRDAGKALRDRVPRSSHAAWTPPPDRPDPIALLHHTARGRLPSLLPIRYGRMLPDPAAFLRGAAVVMAHDLGGTPVTGLRAQICGDAHLDNFGGFNTSGDTNYGALTAVAALTLWAFIGLESATVPAEDVADPERTIPRSTIIGTAIAAVVYILGTAAVMGAIPAATLGKSTAPFADAADEIFGSWAGGWVAAGAAISAFGALNGWILLQGQIPMAAARDRLFPAPFARTTRAGAPVFGLVVSSVLVTGLIFMNYTKSLVDQFTFIILLATLTTLVPYAYSAAAQLMLLATDRPAFSGRRLATDATIALLAFGYTLWAIAGAGYEVATLGVARHAELRESLRAMNIQLSLLNQRVGARVRLKDVDIACLELLARHGPLSPSALARLAGLHPATMTGILDRLEGGGWVARERDPGDRRAVLVRVRKDRNAEMFKFRPVPTYGHLDTFIGKQASKNVYPIIKELLGDATAPTL